MIMCDSAYSTTKITDDRMLRRQLRNTPHTHTRAHAHTGFHHIGCGGNLPLYKKHCTFLSNPQYKPNHMHIRTTLAQTMTKVQLPRQPQYQYLQSHLFLQRSGCFFPWRSSTSLYSPHAYRQSGSLVKVPWNRPLPRTIWMNWTKTSIIIICDYGLFISTPIRFYRVLSSANVQHCIVSNDKQRNKESNQSLMWHSCWSKQNGRRVRLFWAESPLKLPPPPAPIS